MDGNLSVDLPDNGCNYFSSPTNFTNYYNGVASTYVIIEGKAIKTRQTTYSSLPTGYICIGDGVVPYKPEFLAYSQFMSIILCALVGMLLWKTVGRVFGR